MQQSMDGPGESVEFGPLIRPLRTRFQEARDRLGPDWQVMERDYLLMWALAGIASVPELSEKLVFKGGTALKKCYFGDYRFSEDLDFSALEDVPRGAALERCFRESCVRAERMLEPYAPVAMIPERYVEREPHPGVQEAFTIRGRLPWHNSPETWVRVMVEITVDEPVLWPIERRRILHEYGESVDAHVNVYSLEEVVSEKLRAVLQQSKILVQRGWARSRARDYYDLWRVLDTYGDALDVTGFGSLMLQKCAVRDVF